MYVVCILVATVGKEGMRLFPNYLFGNQNTANA